MPEPTTTTTVIGALAGGVSTVTLALLGVDYYSLIWSMVGTLLALYQAEKMGRIRSVIFVVLSTLIGAALGSGLMDFSGSTSRRVLIAVSLVSGFGAHLIVTALLRAGINRIERLGGSDQQIGGS